MFSFLSPLWTLWLYVPHHPILFFFFFGWSVKLRKCQLYLATLISLTDWLTRFYFEAVSCKTHSLFHTASPPVQVRVCEVVKKAQRSMLMVMWRARTFSFTSSRCQQSELRNARWGQHSWSFYIYINKNNESSFYAPTSHLSLHHFKNFFPSFRYTFFSKLLSNHFFMRKEESAQVNGEWLCWYKKILCL